MNRLATLVAGLVLVLCFAGLAWAEEFCPGCLGRGNRACGRCVDWGAGVMLGKCSGCQGWGALNRTPSQCNSCRGTTVCSGCDGKGLPCLVCKGSGRVPDGTNKAIAESRAKAAREGIQKMMGRLSFLVGRWKGSATGVRGKFSSEEKWETILDGSHLRCESRSRYEDGSTEEVLSFLSWQHSQGAYLWTIFVAPGKVFQTQGQPSEDGGKITWQYALKDGTVERFEWTLRPSEKKLGFRTLSMQDGEWVDTGRGGSQERTDAAPGGPIVGATSGTPADADRRAVLEGLKPLEWVLGKWQGTFEGEARKGKGSSTWTPLLDSTFFYTKGKTELASGGVEENVALLTYVPETKKYLLGVFGPGAAVTPIDGTIEDGGKKVTFALQGGRLVWENEGARNKWRIEVAQEGGAFKTVERGEDTRDGAASTIDVPKDAPRKKEQPPSDMPEMPKLPDDDDD